MKNNFFSSARMSSSTMLIFFVRSQYIAKQPVKITAHETEKYIFIFSVNS